MLSKIVLICIRTFNEMISNFSRLIVKSSFELTFWTRIEIESDCSYFQLNSSRVAHIFNSTRLDSTRNWVNSTRLAKNSSLTSRELNIENFPVFDFCITFLHYLLIESHKEKHREKHKGKHKEKHKEKYEEKHEEKPCRLFDQAIYIYLISCRIKSSFRIELSNQASQPDSSSWVQLLNSTRHFFKKISTRLDMISLNFSNILINQEMISDYSAINMLLLIWHISLLLSFNTDEHVSS